MKKILNKVRWNIVEVLKGEEKVPEKGFKVETWRGDGGQIYVEIASKEKLEKEKLEKFFRAIADLTGWEDTRDVMVSVGTWGAENHGTMRYDPRDRYNRKERDDA
jgi:hypothetical protein